MDLVTSKGALRAKFAERFTIVKVDLFYLNVTRDLLPQNLPDLHNIYAFIQENIHSFISAFAPQ